MYLSASQLQADIFTVSAFIIVCPYFKVWPTTLWPLEEYHFRAVYHLREDIIKGIITPPAYDSMGVIRAH